MKRALLLMLVVVVSAGFGAGALYVFHPRTSTRAITVTKTITTHEVPSVPANGTLTVYFPTSCSARTPRLNDAFTLRAPRNGLRSGDVLAAETTAYVGDGCDFYVEFDVTSAMQVFSITDESSHAHWGPITYSQAQSDGWQVNISASSLGG